MFKLIIYLVVLMTLLHDESSFVCHFCDDVARKEIYDDASNHIALALYSNGASIKTQKQKKSKEIIYITNIKI